MITRINLLLLAALVVCALSLVTSRHQARKLFVDLEREQTLSRAYEVEFGQLQIEQSTWAMPASLSLAAVLPLATSSHPRSERPPASSTRPSLS